MSYIDGLNLIELNSFNRLYNKDAIIEYLLDKSAERPNTEVVAHIRSIKVSPKTSPDMNVNNLMYMMYLPPEPHPPTHIPTERELELAES